MVYDVGLLFSNMLDDFVFNRFFDREQLQPRKIHPELATPLAPIRESDEEATAGKNHKHVGDDSEGESTDVPGDESATARSVSDDEFWEQAEPTEAGAQAEAGGV